MVVKLLVVVDYDPTTYEVDPRLLISDYVAYLLKTERNLGSKVYLIDDEVTAERP